MAFSHFISPKFCFGSETYSNINRVYLFVCFKTIMMFSDKYIQNSTRILRKIVNK